MADIFRCILDMTASAPTLADMPTVVFIAISAPAFDLSTIVNTCAICVICANVHAIYKYVI